MRSKQGLLLLLLMALIFLCIHPLSAASLVEKMKKEDQERGRAIAQLKKISQGNGGGSPAASGGNGGMPGENGGSGSPKVQGGGGVTPVYAAGAGNNHHPHHGGGNRHKGIAGMETLALTIFARFMV